MRIFEQNYDFEQDQLIGGEAEYNGDTSLEELYYFSKYVIIADVDAKIDKKIPILIILSALFLFSINPKYIFSNENLNNLI